MLTTSINAAASVGVFFVLRSARESIFPGIGVLAGAVASGIGAMAILRPKFFIFRTTSDEEIPVGLAAILKSFLQAADRGIDRTRAAVRRETTYQGVSPDEQAAFFAVIDDLKSGTTPANLRCVAASLAFQTIAGSDNFVRVLEHQRDA